MSLSAQKARNIQMLQIGKYEGHIKIKIIDAALEGKDHVYVTDEAMGYNLGTLKEQGFDFNYDTEIGEWRISWSK